MKKILVIPGFMRGEEEVALVEKVFSEAAPEFANYGFELVLSQVHNGQPSKLHICDEGKIVASELATGAFAGVVAHSQGTLDLRSSWKYFRGFKGPMVFVEGPNMGVALWKLALMTINGVYPLTRASIRDMWKHSKLMRRIRCDSPPQNNRVLFVLGKFSQWSLAKNVFTPLPYLDAEKILFPDIGHRELMMEANPRSAIINFLLVNCK